jgi:hypothetical protein
MRSSAGLLAPLLISATLAGCGQAGTPDSASLPIRPPMREHAAAAFLSADCGDYSKTFDASFKKTKSLAAVMTALTQQLAAYQLSFRTDPASSGSDISWNALEASDLLVAQKAAAMFTDAWKRESTAWIRSTQLQTVVFAKNITVSGEQRSAMPDAAHHTVYYDPTMLGSCESDDEEIMHHEFYHLAESTLFGDYYYQDPTWLSYNPAGFTYVGAGSAAYTDPNYNAAEHPEPGFVDDYATYAIEEDMAETYGYLQTPDFAKRALGWAKTDKILGEKIAYLQSIIARFSK